MSNAGTYIASRASLPARSAAWRRLRDDGWKITCSWIDEAGPGESPDLGALWSRIDPISFRPIGSWVRHPLVSFCETMEEALEGATFNL